MQNVKQFHEKVGNHHSGIGNCTWDQEAGRRARLEKALLFQTTDKCLVWPWSPCCTRHCQKAVRETCEKATNHRWDCKSKYGFNKSEPSSAVFAGICFGPRDGLQEGRKAMLPWAGRMCHGSRRCVERCHGFRWTVSSKNHSRRQILSPNWTRRCYLGCSASRSSEFWIILVHLKLAMTEKQEEPVRRA